MRITALRPSIRSGNRPVVEFTKKIENFETYFEAGMRAVLKGIEIDAEEADDIVYRFDFSFAEFVDFNQSIEKPTYFDQYGEPTQTASEAGWVPKDHRESLFIGESEEAPVEVEHFFSFIHEEQLSLYQEFKNSSEKSYVQWLEHRVLRSKNDVS